MPRDAVRAAEFVVVVSRQRSSSTVLSQAIAAFHPCVTWTNEIFHREPAARLRRECGTQDRFSGKLLRAHGKAALHTSRFSQPVEFLRAVRDLQLSVQWPRQGCSRAAYALVFKLFDGHLHGRLQQSGLKDLLSDPRTAVVVLERDPAASECSLSWARHSADWGVVPARHSDAYAAYQSKHCAGMPSPTYQAAHVAWYRRVRGLLRQLRKPFLDVTFNQSTNELMDVINRVYALAHLWGAQWLATRDVRSLPHSLASVLNETCDPPPISRPAAGAGAGAGAGASTNRYKRSDG